jgi:hypothetical protein
MNEHHLCSKCGHFHEQLCDGEGITAFADEECPYFNSVDKQYDEVTYPAHYTQGNVEVIDFIRGMDFHQGNIIKYLARFKFKNGKQDLRKALFYLEDAIAHYDSLYGE